LWFWQHYYVEAIETSRNQGFQAGFQIGYREGFNQGNQTGYKVGYEQGLQTGFSTTGYTCWNFAAEVKNNAFKAGYRCGLVYIEFEFSAHAIVCFNTTDKGLIFVDPQNDKIVKVEISTDYWTDNGYDVIVFDETIIHYGIVW